MYGVTMLYGVEANIIDYDGKLDMDDETLEKLDIVIGSIHDEVYKIGTIEENTSAFINVIKIPYMWCMRHCTAMFCCS